MNLHPPRQSTGLQSLILLFSNPHRFFAERHYEVKPIWLWVLGYLIGMERTITLSYQLSDVGKSAESLKGLLDNTVTWAELTGLVLTFALVFGPISVLLMVAALYVRLAICAIGHPTNIRDIVSIVLFSNGIYALPVLLHRLAQSLAYRDPVTAYLDIIPPIYDSCLSALTLLSYYALYTGVRAVYYGSALEAAPSKAFKFCFAWLPFLIWISPLLTM